MTKRQTAKLNRKLEQQFNCLKDEGKDLHIRLVSQGIHPWEAMQLILEQHADLCNYQMRYYL